MQKFKPDKKDFRILSELDMDARQPISRIARKVRLSKEVTNYRIKRLEKEGIIEGYYAAIDICRLGYLYCRYHLWFYSLDTETERDIIKYVKSHPSISWVVSTEGNEDLVIVIRARNVPEIKSVCDDIYYKFSRFIKQKQIYIISKIHHFKHNYLYGSKSLRREILGKSHDKVDIDIISINILNLLSKNARLPSSEIASKAGLTSNAVRMRIKKLIQERVILCFRSQIDINRLGYQHFKLFLRLKDITQDSYHRIIEFLRKEPRVIYITESVGQADLEFEIIVINNAARYEFMKELKALFGQYISDHSFYFVYKEQSINYLPA